jgi:hypothetical protein
MPEKLKHQLMIQAKKKKLKGEAFDAYVYGTLRKTGWTPTREQKKKDK